MSALKQISRSPIFIICAFVLGVLMFGLPACESTPTAEPTTAAPSAATEAAPPAAAPTTAPAEEQGAPAETQVEEAPAVALDQAIIGFWRTKVVGKQVIVFEFMDGGKTIWHYAYNNGQKKDNEGIYSISGDILSVDVGGPQELTAKLEGDTLTLTGANDVVLTLKRANGVNVPSPTASTNIAQDIVGRWQDPATQEWMEFKADGSVAITSSTNDLSGTYTVSGFSLEMKLSDQGQSSIFTVEIDGNVLTLYVQDGTFTDYVK